jgi:hypothetical protein
VADCRGTYNKELARLSSVHSCDISEMKMSAQVSVFEAGLMAEHGADREVS